MGTEGRVSLDLRVSTGDEINGAIAEGVLEALDRHGRDGRSVIAWVDGNVVEVPPDRLEIHSEFSIGQAKSIDDENMFPE